jgi:hypothetical protein
MMNIRRLLTGILPPVLLVAAGACSTETALQQVLGLSTEAPIFLACKAVSPKEINFQFSKPVKVSSMKFDPPIDVESVAEGDTVQVNLGQTVAEGIRVVADILVEDEQGNTLNVLIPFRTRNDRIPGFLITELRTEYSKPKVEYVEIKTLTAGNLGALRLFTASNSMDVPVFEFPPAEVKAGEYILIHLRALEPENVNETGENLGASGGTEAFTDVRDFWAPSEKKILRASDAVIFLDQDDRVIDAVILSETPDVWWDKDGLVQAAEFLGRTQAWLPADAETGRIPTPADAVITTGTTPTRTICRDEAIQDNNLATDWYIAATSNASPGKPNKTNRYEPK